VARQQTPERKRTMNEAEQSDKKTIFLPNGYNGHVVECDVEPLERDGNLLRLRVTGSTYLTRWCHVEDLASAIQEQHGMER
jgi:hypothetical protein